MKKDTEISKSVKQEDDESIDDSLYDPFAPEAMEPLEEPVEEEPNTKVEDIKLVSSRQPIKKRRDQRIYTDWHYSGCCSYWKLFLLHRNSDTRVR